LKTFKRSSGDFSVLMRIDE